MSMFRKPGESSSSSSEDESSDHREVTEASLDDALLSRINTLDSAQSALSASGPSVQVASGPPPVLNVRDLALHSLLEDKATAEAAEHLGKDKADPEVQELARKTYRGLAQQLSGTTSDIYSSDEMKEQRAVAREGIHNATRFQLAGRAGATDASPIAATAAIAEASQAMIPRSILGQTGDQNINVETLPGLQSPVPIPVPLFLQGYPGLNTDRYTRDYEEFELVGKGGYGKVYKVKHKLDNSFYAVKKIIVSPSKMQKIQEQGPQELESLLGEVRSLAGFDHGNIVRYHSAWLEFSAACASAPLSTSNVALGPKRLLPSPSGPSFSASDTDHLRTSFENASLLEEDTHDSGADIMFENSDSGTGAENPESGVPGPPSIEGMSRRANRRGSEATIITISSTHSHLSTVEEAVHEDEEDVEVIPRTHSPTLEESDSMMSNSDMPTQLMTMRHTGPVLTLNVQMSLYDSNLAAFLSTEQTPPTHCFHPCISLELLGNIISGVQYLHSKGVVHRDLKPANIFLALSDDRYPPAGSVDLSSCDTCPAKKCLHVTPRIGDFGLVAAVGDSGARPVGTEFYRPPNGGKIDEKLDVFALGVVAFEMLNYFGTKMERIDALYKLRRGEIGGDFGEEILELIGEMVAIDEEKRLDCELVRKQIKKIVGEMKRD